LREIKLEVKPGDQSPAKSFSLKRREDVRRIVLKIKWVRKGKKISTLLLSWKPWENQENEEITKFYVQK
jgi:hypothetical protein